MSSSGGNMPRLGPAWRSSGSGPGKGFQPPPAVPDERATSRERSGSHASGGSSGGGGGDKNRNPFAMLDDEEDGGGGKGGERNTGGGEGGGGGGGRFAALRSDNHSSSSSRPYHRASSGGPKPQGRSLADLAAGLSSKGDSAPEHRGHHRGEHDHHGHRDPRSLSRSSSSGVPPRRRSGSGEALMGPSSDGDKKVIRYTREKLLSLRGRGDDELPECLKLMEDSVVVSKVAQDPVCWDTFDPEEAWASAGREHRRTSDRGPPGVPKGPGRLRDFDSGDEGEHRPRGSINAPRGSFDGRGTHTSSGGGFGSGGGGRWQRGVVVPDSGDRLGSRGRDSRDRQRDPNYVAENPDELWDDPGAGGGTGAAADFSAFGGSLEDDHPKGRTGMDTFELSDMSAAAAAFENELHGDRKSDNGEETKDEGDDTISHHVDPSRPLASTGTTIRSGSGNDVNVFEDFGDEPAGAGVSGGEGEELPIKSGKEEHNASSRLMKMIGVAGTGEAGGGLGAGGEAQGETKMEEPIPSEDSTNPAEASIASNPWGAPASAVSNNPWGGAPSGSGGMNGMAFASQQAKEAEAAAQRKQEEARLRQQQQDQELQRRRQLQEEQARQQQQAAAQAQQQQAEQLKAQQTQVELVLIERISNILENSWGRSDLNSILSTLHANDSRVIAILSTVEALRALMARHPQRIQLGRDPTMGAEMAALRLTNSQWQAQQAQLKQREAMALAQQQAQEQELLRQRAAQEEQARRQEALARAQAAQREAEERKKQEQQQPPVFTNAPWYYADPQGNIQGPFAGDEMRQWLEAGYFKSDLPISQNASGPFRSLGSYFSESSTAFQVTEPKEDKSAKEAAEARARAQKEAAHAKAMAEAQAAREQSAAEEAARQRAAQAQAAKEAEEARARAEKEAADKADQSNQLKMMLGLGASSSGDGVAGPPPPEPVAPVPAPQPAPTSKKQAKKAQKQQKAQGEPVAAPAPEPVPAPKPAPAWGGAKTAQAGRKKSMSEIQQEEAREAARRAKEQGLTGGGQKSGGGWANIAATGGSTAWGGAAARVPAAAVVTPAPVPAVSAQKATAWDTQPAAPAPAAAAPKKQAQQQKAATTNAAPVDAVDNFGAGGRMAPALESWCKEQMSRLNGSEDLTLVSFCMTLTDSDEIRQYLTAYLGSTPAVNNFATEFIKRKGGANGKEEEWESAGGPKGKGRKKRGGK